MEYFIKTLGGLLFIWVAWLGIVFLRKLELNNTTQALRELASQFQGRVEPGSIFQSPRLTIPFQSTELLLYLKQTLLKSNRRSDKLFLKARLNIPSSLSLTVKVDGLGMQKVTGWIKKDIWLNDKEFDEQFWVSGHSEAFVRSVLTDNVRAALLLMVDLPNSSGFVVKLRDGNLSVVLYSYMLVNSQLLKVPVGMTLLLIESILYNRNMAKP